MFLQAMSTARWFLLLKMKGHNGSHESDTKDVQVSLFWKQDQFQNCYVEMIGQVPLAFQFRETNICHNINCEQLLHHIKA